MGYAWVNKDRVRKISSWFNTKLFPVLILVEYSALDKLLGQLGIYATWLSSIAYLQKQLRIFLFFSATFFSVITYVFLLNKAIVNVPT